jgi:hypothetical protein
VKDLYHKAYMMERPIGIEKDILPTLLEKKELINVAKKSKTVLKRSQKVMACQQPDERDFEYVNGLFEPSMKKQKLDKPNGSFLGSN